MPSPYSDGEFYKNNTIFNPFISNIVKKLVPGTAIDFGCGIGTNIYNLKQMGWNVYGVEREPIAVQRAKNLIGNDNIIAKDINKIDFSELPDFDLALCNYVFQHLTKNEAYTFLNNLFSRKKKESYFIISFFEKRDGITFSEIIEYLNDNDWTLESSKRWERLDTSHGLPHIHQGIESFWSYHMR